MRTVIQLNNCTCRLYFSNKLYNKIKEWCKQVPDKEWSGILFYKVDAHSNFNYVFTGEDLFVANVGSATFTEFDNNEEVLNYQAINNLLDCQCALIHSHQSFNSFFSNTDNSTLIEKSEHMPHFLSVIVNNNEEYIAKFTRKIDTNLTHYSYKTFENQKINGSSEIEEHYLDIQNVNIIIKDKKYVSYEKEVKERVKELTSEVKSIIKSTVKTPTFIPADQEEVSEISPLLISETLAQIITMSLTSKADSDTVNKNIKAIEKAIFKRFDSIEEYFYVLNNFIDCVFYTLPANTNTNNLITLLLENLENYKDSTIIKVVREVLLANTDNLFKM